MDEQEIMEMETEKLWNTIQVKIRSEEINITKTELNTIKEGKKLKFPIYYLTNKWYSVYPETKSIEVDGYGRVDIKEFMEEKEERDAIMRHALIRSIDDEATTPRVN